MRRGILHLSVKNSVVMEKLVMGSFQANAFTIEKYAQFNLE